MSAEHTPMETDAPSIAAAVRGDLVIVEVGPDRVRHHVHKPLLAHHSEYFRNMLRGPWKEAQEGLVPLHDIEPKVFSLFVHWLYTQQLPTSGEEWARVIECEYSRTAHCELCLRSYVFGDRFLAPLFRRTINNFFVKCMQMYYFWQHCEQGIVTYAFTNIPPDRPILQLIADEYRVCWDHGLLFEGDEDAFTPVQQRNLPADLLVRVMEGYRARNLEASPYNAKSIRCYLEHATEQEAEMCNKLHFIFDAKKEHGQFR